MVPLNEALALANCTVPHERRSMVEQNEIDLVGAQGPSYVAGKIQLKIKTITRIKLGVVPNRDVNIR